VSATLTWMIVALVVAVIVLVVLVIRMRAAKQAAIQAAHDAILEQDRRMMAVLKASPPATAKDGRPPGGQAS
jgi:uncharacterized membrane protein